MSINFSQLRTGVLRRVRYATNTLALSNNTIPPEGPFDAGLTNGLAAIVAYDWPGEELSKRGGVKPARDLLLVIDDYGCPSPFIDTRTLGEGLDLTQPARHARDDDEFAALQRDHIQALLALDEHPALMFLTQASEAEDLDDAIWRAFMDRAQDELPFDLKDRFDTPDPEICDDCGRPTFLPLGWDMFGGTMTAGTCIACGYARTDGDADAQALDDEILRLMEKRDK
jgi:hypothetical protein